LKLGTSELKGAQEPEVVYCHRELKWGLIWGYKCAVVASQSGVEKRRWLGGRGGGWGLILSKGEKKS